MEVERIETTVVLYTFNPKKGHEWVDKKMKQGFKHERTDSECTTWDVPKFRFEISKLEPFK